MDFSKSHDFVRRKMPSKGKTMTPLAEIKLAMQNAAQQAQRSPEEIRLIAVSKMQTVDKIQALFQDGQRDFGENYVQEFSEKAEKLRDLPIVWHFIGALQSNKTRTVAELAHWVHSIDREKIAQRLNDQRPATLPPLQICLQVNISHEAQKSGVLPENIEKLAKFIENCPNLQLRGLMCLPENDLNEVDMQFSAMKALFLRLKTQFPQIDTLSMGMSQDFPLAILHGATMIRVGTALFGARA